MRKLQVWTLGAVVLGFPGCMQHKSDLADDFGYEGTGIQVSIAPLTLDSLSDACYSFQIVNGANELVVARGPSSLAAGSGDSTADAVCASRFGNGDGGDISYVAPCDSQQPTHTVTLWVNALCESTAAAGSPETNIGAGCDEIQSYVDPCPEGAGPGSGGCSLEVTCQENADTPVTFNFTIMGQADQGFFDVAVNFDDVFCSAKLDDCNTFDEAIKLITDPDSGERIRTAVAAIACTAGPDSPATGGVTTHLNVSALSITCQNGVGPVTQGTLDFATLTGEGNATIGDFPAGVYFGTESLPGANKVYTTVAIGIGDSSGCQVTWNVIPSHKDLPELTWDNTWNSYGYVRFDGGDLGGSGCNQHPLDGQDSAVTTTYVDNTNHTEFFGPAGPWAYLPEGGDAFAALGGGGPSLGYEPVIDDFGAFVLQGMVWWNSNDPLLDCSSSTGAWNGQYYAGFWPEQCTVEVIGSDADVPLSIGGVLGGSGLRWTGPDQASAVAACEAWKLDPASSPPDANFPGNATEDTVFTTYETSLLPCVPDENGVCPIPASARGIYTIEVTCGATTTEASFEL
jgi:hypothetical protein